MDTLFSHPGHIFLVLIMTTLPHVSLEMRMYDFTDVRLVNGSFGAPNSGRVEVQLDSAWLDVCDDRWDPDDGIVACRQLGYPGFSQTKRMSYFGQGTNSGSVDRFGCGKEETSLSECQLEKELSASGCRDRRGAGLICTQPGYIGCYRDNTRDRVFGGNPLSSDRMNITLCLNHCREMAGMQVAGLQAGNECYCGGADTELTKHGNKRMDKECSDACSGNPDEFCGRGGMMLHLSVYNAVETTEEPMGPAYATTDVGATTEMTTREMEPTANTETTPSDAPDRTPTTAMRTQTPEATMTEPEVTPGEENGSNSPSATTARATTQPPLPGVPGNRDGSKAGTYVGLAIGCILFIVCACLIVVCLLRRGQRKRDQNGIRSIIPLASGVEQHSAVYGNSEVQDRIAMSRLGQSETGYTAPNPSPAHSLDINKGKEGVLVGAVATEKEAPNRRNQQAVVNPLYLGAEPDSSPKRSAKRPETNDTTSDGDGTDYFAVEEKGNSMGSAQYSTGATGDEAPPQRRQTPLQISDLSTPEDADIDDHYYSSANPPSSTGARVPQNDPLQEEDYVYTYADPPERITGAQRQWGVDKSPNADYFAIEESGNSMGIPLYGVGEKGASKKNQPSAPPKEEAGKRDQRGAESDGDEYAYADPAGLGEGWVENTVYVSGP